MKKFLSWAAPALMASMLFVGCQKSLESVSEDGLRDGTQLRTNSSTTCATCVDEWTDNSLGASTANTNQNKNAELTIWNDAEKIYIKVSGDDDYNQVKISYPYALNNGGNIIYNYASGVYPTDQNNLIYEFPISGTKAKCQLNELQVQVEGMGGGNSTSSKISYYLNELCTTTTLTPASTTLCVGDPSQTLTATVSAQEAFAGGTLVIQEETAPATWTTVASVNVTAGVKSVTYDAVTTNEGTRTFQAVYSGSTLVKGSTSSSATVTVENCGCDDEFSALLQCAGGLPPLGTGEDFSRLIVTFTPCEDGDYVLQGGLTAGAVITTTSAPGFTLDPDHASAGGPSSVTRWEGTLVGGLTYTITIEFTGGNGVGSWSAKSKVDGVEVVNGSSDEQECN